MRKTSVMLALALSLSGTMALTPGLAQENPNKMPELSSPDGSYTCSLGGNYAVGRSKTPYIHSVDSSEWHSNFIDLPNSIGVLKIPEKIPENASDKYGSGLEFATDTGQPGGPTNHAKLPNGMVFRISTDFDDAASAIGPDCTVYTVLRASVRIDALGNRKTNEGIWVPPKYHYTEGDENIIFDAVFEGVDQNDTINKIILENVTRDKIKEYLLKLQNEKLNVSTDYITEIPSETAIVAFHSDGSQEKVAAWPENLKDSQVNDHNFENNLFTNPRIGTSLLATPDGKIYISTLRGIYDLEGNLIHAWSTVPENDEPMAPHLGEPDRIAFLAGHARAWSDGRGVLFAKRYLDMRLSWENTGYFLTWEQIRAGAWDSGTTTKLSEYYPENYLVSGSFYNSPAWGGLKGSISFSKQDRITAEEAQNLTLPGSPVITRETPEYNFLTYAMPEINRSVTATWSTDEDGKNSVITVTPADGTTFTPGLTYPVVIDVTDKASGKRIRREIQHTPENANDVIRLEITEEEAPEGGFKDVTVNATVMDPVDHAEGYAHDDTSWMKPGYTPAEEDSGTDGGNTEENDENSGTDTTDPVENESSTENGSSDNDSASNDNTSDDGASDDGNASDGNTDRDSASDGDKNTDRDKESNGDNDSDNSDDKSDNNTNKDKDSDSNKDKDSSKDKDTNENKASDTSKSDHLAKTGASLGGLLAALGLSGGGAGILLTRRKLRRASWTAKNA